MPNNSHPERETRRVKSFMNQAAFPLGAACRTKRIQQFNADITATTGTNLGMKGTPTIGGTLVTLTATNMHGVRCETAAGPAAFAGPISSDFGETGFGYDPEFYCRVRPHAGAHTTTSVRMWHGMWSVAEPAADDPSTPNQIAAFRYSTAAGDTNWQCYVTDGTTSTIVDSGVAVTAAEVYELGIRVLDAGTRVQFLIDNRKITTVTKTLTALCGWGCRHEALSATTKRASWNRVAIAY